ncbi:MAG: 50S ribosomal protein L40e [Candidatus Diapherotrites archaeon]
MARFEAAENRLFNNVWVCMRCNARNRSGTGKPDQCRKCNSPKLRLKNKTAKKKA